jgi:hypothetical protein
MGAPRLSRKTLNIPAFFAMIDDFALCIRLNSKASTEQIFLRAIQYDREGSNAEQRSLIAFFYCNMINTPVTHPVPGTPALDIGAPPPRPIDDIRGRWADVPGAL